MTATQLQPDRPVALPVNLDGIPEELQRYKRWVIWRYELRDDSWTKVPRKPWKPYARAQSNGPGTWGSFELAAAAYAAGACDGIGFVLGRLDDGRIICGADLDKYIVDGIVDASVSTIVDTWGSYIETSPSSTGLKGLWISTTPIRNRVGKDQHGVGVELFSSGKFFTLTGGALWWRRRANRRARSQRHARAADRRAGAPARRAGSRQGAHAASEQTYGAAI